MEGDESIAIILRNRWSKLKCLWLHWWSRPKRETFSAFRGRWQIFRSSNTCTLPSKKNFSWSKKRMMSSFRIAHALISHQCACVGAPYRFHDCVPQRMGSYSYFNSRCRIKASGVRDIHKAAATSSTWNLNISFIQMARHRRSSLYGRGIVNFADSYSLRSHIPLRSCLVGLILWSANVNWDSCMQETSTPSWNELYGVILAVLKKLSHSCLLLCKLWVHINFWEEKETGQNGQLKCPNN